MSLLFPEKISTDFYQSQEIIARKYLEHFCAYLNSLEDIAECFGERFFNGYSGEGGFGFDDFDGGYNGRTVAIGFDDMEESRLELINAHSVVAFCMQCRSIEGNKTGFTFEFEPDDESFLSMLPEKVKKYLELGGYEDDSDDLLLD